MAKKNVDLLKEWLATDGKASYEALRGTMYLNPLYLFSEWLDSRLTPDAPDGAKAGETLRYWQHDETGRQCARAQRPSPRWFEITQGQYDGSDDDYPAKPPRR